MKVKNIIEVKQRYSFEAPVLPVAAPAGLAGKFGTDIARLDLNNMLAPVPDNVFLVRVNGESMIDVNIYDGDILIVDKKNTPRDGSIVIAALNGEMAVKKYRIIEGKVYLYSANNRFYPIEILPDWNFSIQGVVRHVIHEV